MSKLKIAQVAPYYYPSIGGVEKVVQCISEGLVKRGREVSVLTSRRNHKGKAAQQTVREKYAQSSVMDQVETLYEDLLSRKSRRRAA